KQPAEVKIAASVKPAVVKEPERPKESPKPVPEPYAAPELALPSLAMAQSGGFWSKLPVAGKAGISVAGLAAVIGIVMLVGKGGSGQIAAGPQIVEAGPALPAVDSGWITDWGAEPGVRRAREISVLRPSMNLTDYRVTFQAQIESKALGW